jgi:hypothetical protein
VRGLGWLALAAVAALDGCGPDADRFQLQLILERRDDQADRCSTDSCTGIPMGCDAAVEIRVVDAADGDIAYVSECLTAEPLVPGQGDLCALEMLDIRSRQVPNTMVRIQVAVWPYVTEPPEEATAGCPDVIYDRYGKVHWSSPLPRPAIAGESYFQVGSSDVATVRLGCVNTEPLDTACRLKTVHVTAGVLKLETRGSVSAVEGSRLLVSVGEPQFREGGWALASGETVVLGRAFVGPTPIWEGDVPGPFEQAACIQVAGDATPSVHCRLARPTDAAVSLGGVLVDPATLDRVLDAVGSLPQAGLVIGVVVDARDDETAGVEVTATNGATIEYLSGDLSSIVPAATATTRSGMFISRDAAFATNGEGVTAWHAQIGEIRERVPGYGGQVQGKITVVVLELEAAIVDSNRER